jgi:hypothetical protein
MLYLVRTQIKKTMKNIILIPFLLFSVFSTALGQANFEFNEEVHDFGTFNEGDIMDFEFEFTNTGNEALSIQSVRASCGCTTPFWTKEPIAVGEKGTIKVRYNSKDRPGNFYKTVTIKSNVSTTNKVLTIKGTAYRDPALEPKMTLERMAFNIGKVELSEGTRYAIDYKNMGKIPLKILNVQSSCNCFSRAAPYDAVKENERGTLVLIYKPKQLGKFKETIYLSTNNREKAIISVEVSGEVVEALDNTSMLKEGNENPFGN